MSGRLYAVVAYVRNSLGSFVEDLRHDLHPGEVNLPAHLTILPPRPLQGTEEEAQRLIQEVCGGVAPFEVLLGDVETFVPTTPTVFVRVAHAGYRVRELHDKLNTGALFCQECWPYMPHLTIIKLAEEEAARHAARLARQRWAKFNGPRAIRIEEVTFVREGCCTQPWIDLAPISLGSRLAPASR